MGIQQKNMKAYSDWFDFLKRLKANRILRNIKEKPNYKKLMRTIVDYFKQNNESYLDLIKTKYRKTIKERGLSTGVEISWFKFLIKLGANRSLINTEEKLNYQELMRTIVDYFKQNNKSYLKLIQIEDKK